MKLKHTVIGIWTLTGIVVVTASAPLLLGAQRSASEGGDVEGTRVALQKWVETRRSISLEQRDWTLGREMLNERIELVQRETESLRGKITETESSITEADRARATLVEENDRLKQVSDALGSTVESLEMQTKTLLPRLPEPIRERVKPLSQRLPDNAAETKLSLAERFQNVVGILNEVNKFNREITVTSEVRTLSDGASVEVTALYLGIGKAYYVGRNATIAGVGSASAAGWAWTPANDAAPRIADVIAILKNEKAAAFVQLPITID